MMAAGVVQHLLESEASGRVREVLREATDSNVLYLDFDRDFDEMMRAAFRSALRAYIANSHIVGDSVTLNPDHCRLKAKIGKFEINQAA